VVEAEETGVRVPVVIKVVEATRATPLEEAPELAQHDGAMLEVNIEALDVVQTLAVEA
jgi:hypothetical protein